MKITSSTARISQSEIHETSSKKYLNNIISKVSKCAFAALILLTTFTTLIAGAIAHPIAGAAADPGVPQEDPFIPPTPSKPIDSVRIVPIEEALAAATPGPTKCRIIPDHAGLHRRCFNEKSENDSWWCTIL